MADVRAGKGGVLVLIGWSRYPRSADKLFEIMKHTEDEELVCLMTAVGGTSGRLAWAEYGRRKWGVPYGIQDGCAVPYMAAECSVWS